MSSIFVSILGALTSIADFFISKSIFDPLISSPAVVIFFFIPASTLTLTPKPFLFFPVLFFTIVFETLIGAKPFVILFKLTGSSTGADKIPLNKQRFDFSEDLDECFPFPIEGNSTFNFGFPFKLTLILGTCKSILGPFALISPWICGIEPSIFILIPFGSVSFLISISIGDLLGKLAGISFLIFTLISPIFGNFNNFSGI